MVRQSVIRITDRKCRCAIFAVSEPKASPDLRPKTTEPIEKTNLFVKPSAIEFTRIAEAGKRKTKFNDTMKRIWMTTFLSLTLCAGPCGGRARANDNPPQEKTANPKVYLTRTITPEALVRIYEALGREATGRVAVKLSTGEPGGHHFLQPALVAPLVRKVGGTIVECNTAYGGGRARTADHLKAAADHGFTAIAAVDIMDAEGETALPVEGGRHLAEDYVGKNFLNYDFTVVLSHFKGHAMGGFGGAIKNISIGIASSAGKAWIHSAGKTKNAAEMWSALPPQDDFLESMAEAAKAVADHCGERILYINVMNNLSVDCDAHPAAPGMGDIGILASTDPVALDKACVDLVYASDDPGKVHLIERIESRHGTHTLDHAAAIALDDRKEIFERIDIHIRRHLRKLIWRAWKRPKTRERELRRRGLPSEQAWKSSVNGRGPWWNTNAPHMRKAFPNSVFRRMGLYSLLSKA